MVGSRTHDGPHNHRRGRARQSLRSHWEAENRFSYHLILTCGPQLFAKVVQVDVRKILDNRIGLMQILDPVCVGDGKDFGSGGFCAADTRDRILNGQAGSDGDGLFRALPIKPVEAEKRVVDRAFLWSRLLRW